MRGAKMTKTLVGIAMLLSTLGAIYASSSANTPKASGFGLGALAVIFGLGFFLLEVKPWE
jgi:hypothetical protein